MAQHYRVTELVNLSAVFITHNSASRLEDALRSVQFCRDIVILDAGSTDGTLDMARRYGARVFHQDKAGLVPPPRKAVSLAKYDWILRLNADERVSADLANSIIAALARPQFQAWQLPRSHFFINRYLRHGEGYPDLSVRLFNRQQACWTEDAAQGDVKCDSVVGQLQGDLLCHGAETLDAYLAQQQQLLQVQAGIAAAQGKPPSMIRLWISPLLRFIHLYVLRRGFLDGWPGLVRTAAACFSGFAKDAKVRTLLQARNPDQG